MKNIASAFVKAQRSFAPALKTNTNPHFRSKYVALDGCIEAVIDALNSNGIALLQQTHECESGVMVETLFLHESGETMSGGKLHVPASKHDAQGYGSALTYARRYSLMAACGIAPEDDDGNAATKAPRHSPVEPVAVPPHRMAIVSDCADAIRERMAANDDVGAYEIASGVTDPEEKQALWKLLDSKTRSAIKKHAESLKEVA
jgi:hypothetical protein